MNKKMDVNGLDLIIVKALARDFVYVAGEESYYMWEVFRLDLEELERLYTVRENLFNNRVKNNIRTPEKDKESFELSQRVIEYVYAAQNFLIEEKEKERQKKIYNNEIDRIIKNKETKSLELLSIEDLKKLKK